MDVQARDPDELPPLWKRDLREFLAEYPGVKWLAGSVLLIGIGSLLAATILYGAGVFLIFLGGLGTIEWRGRDDLRHGWPPRSLAWLLKHDDQPAHEDEEDDARRSR